MASAMEQVFGKVYRWRVGDIFFAKNDWISMAYAVTDDPAKVGTVGLHGPEEMCVEFIGADKAKLWDNSDNQQQGARSD